MYYRTSIPDCTHINSHMYAQKHAHTYIYIHTYSTTHTYTVFLLCGNGTPCQHKRKTVHLVRLTSLQYLHFIQVYTYCPSLHVHILTYLNGLLKELHMRSIEQSNHVCIGVTYCILSKILQFQSMLYKYVLTHTRTDTQTDRQTDRQACRQTGTHVHTHVHIHKHN